MLRGLFSKPQTHKPAPALTPPQAWSIAAGANLAALRDDRLDSLASGKPANEMRTMLHDWWGVNDAKSLYETLDWLEREGHSARFRQALALVRNLSEQEFQYTLTQVQGKERVQLELARTSPVSDTQALVGWDLGRSINITRAGFDAGYIDEARAWHEILGAAQIIQITFSSWQELCDNYLLGRQFWGGSQDTDKYLVQKAKWLVQDASSPWKQLAWNLKLV